jgi:hypothetical protein
MTEYDKKMYIKEWEDVKGEGVFRLDSPGYKLLVQNDISLEVLRKI